MKSTDRKTGFTIIELLTVMSIIVILIALLVPSLNSVRRYSRVVRQKGQFHDIGTGLEMFSIDFDGYPDSKRMDVDTSPQRYCGAMKLCEAMIGQDGLGYHPDSRLTLLGKDKDGKFLYYPKWPADNRRERKHTYVDTDKYRRCPIEELYADCSPWASGASADPCACVISDVFTTIKGQFTGIKFGMPILYYKADVTKMDHSLTVSDDTQLGKNIYDIRDNDDLTRLIAAGISDPHPLHGEIITGVKYGYQIFYENTWNKKVTAATKPYNENTFILISAGWDGLYGTRDDVYNFAE
jgi:prepilin-type N-terminal cleavage/methylation domain-containing protein